MSFTEFEIAQHNQVVETLFWSRRRPPPHVRNQLRDGQRITGREIELFFVRPRYNRLGEFMEDSIAKLRHFPGLGVWRLYWKRADRRWYGYKPCLEVASLEEGLRVVDADAYACFFG